MILKFPEQVGDGCSNPATLCGFNKIRHTPKIALHLQTGLGALSSMERASQCADRTLHFTQSNENPDDLINLLQIGKITLYG